MSTSRCKSALLAAIALLCAAIPARAFEAGAAKQEITPPLGTPLNGYGDRFGRPSLSVHDPLWARALYLDDGETKVLLVNADLCMINPELRARVVELMPAELPKEGLILTATHDHSATGGMNRHYPLRFVAGRYSQEVLDFTAQNIVTAMKAAYDARKRAAIGFGTTTQDNLSRNRRVNNGPIDPQVGVLKVDDADGNPIAAVTNFAGHPTYVPDADHYVISADYPGVYYNEMERLAGGGVALFLNGAEGNQGIGNPENKDGWERMESVGRLLAVKADELRKKIDCSEMKLKLSQATPELPLSLAGFQPRTVLMQVLEIGDLAMTFLPGEPVVEIGLELRKQALARGYKTHFTVGLSNDYLNYFVTRELYPGFYYETGMSFFGPGMADWFYHQSGALYTRGEQPPAPTLAAAPAKKDLGNGATVVTLSGDARAMGQQRARVFAEDIHAKFNERVLDPVASGKSLPKAMPWTMIPPFADVSALLPALMGGAMRPRLQGLSPSLYAEVEGMAEGVKLPFDAMWLLQNARETALREDRGPLFVAPLCTMFAVLQEGRVLVGRNLDWNQPESPVITEYAPKDGLHFMQIGFSWNAGIFTGMNEAGLVLSVEHVDGLGEQDLQVTPIEFIVRDLLATATTAAAAVETLRAQTGQHGYHVLVAGPGASGFEANVIEYGKEITVRAPEDGVLLGVLPSNELADADTLIRYARVADLLATAPGKDVENLQKILGDSEQGRALPAQIWNPDTRHAVVFDPQKLAALAAFPTKDGAPGPFQRVVLSKGGKS